VAARPSRSPGATSGRPGPQAHRARPDRKALPTRPGPPVSPGEAPPRARRSPTANEGVTKSLAGVKVPQKSLWGYYSRLPLDAPVTVGCPSGWTATGAGFAGRGGNLKLIAASPLVWEPQLAGQRVFGWRVQLGIPRGDQARDGSAHKWSARVYVMCMKLT